MEDCYFKQFGKCTSPQGGTLSTSGSERIRSVIQASQQRGDTLHTNLQSSLTENPNYEIVCHRNCVSTYCSKEKIKRFLKSKERSSSAPPPLKRTRRSESTGFDFKIHCIFCGEQCIESRDSKNPSRWRPVNRCRTLYTKPGQKSMKDAILDVCKQRSDTWSQEVELRVRGAVSDLHAAEARYHVDCKPAFMAPKSVDCSQDICSPDEDVPFSTIISIMESDRNRMWSSVELHNLYAENNGTKLQRRALIDALSEHLGDEILVLSCKGLASLVVFRSRASQLFHLVDESEVDSDTLKTVARQIKQESKTTARDTSSYSSKIDINTARSQCSETLLSLLAQISPQLDGTIGACLIGNMISSTVTHTPTALQIALGVTIREKYFINTLYDFLVTCSYDEVLRFKTSAAVHAAKDSDQSGLFDAEQGLIQTVVDNYDANINSLNGLSSTHALAMLLCQTPSACTVQVAEDDHEIPRLTKTDMTKPIDGSVAVHHYDGPKRPDMLQVPPVNDVDHESLLAHQEVSLSRARELDLDFFKGVSSSDNACEYGGYLTRTARNQSHTVQPATEVRYRPLIDLKPSDPSTVKTAMVEAQRLTSKSGQEFTVLTADQQIYKVIVDNIWASPAEFNNIYPRLGGMHTLMSFCGGIGKLMIDSGLADILKCAFGGVDKMLSGKKFPQNVRAFRLLTEELLRDLLDGIDSFAHMDATLSEVSNRSATAKLWVDCFVRPCHIMMTFIRAERESDWPLHLWCVEQMLPYFFASGHVNYARYGLYYLRSMQSLPPEVQSRFMKGEHTMRHVPGAANATWSDMFIETTFMRYGHSKGGLTGITLNDNATKRWALSLHSCSQLIHDIAEMREYIPQLPAYHKEETKARIRSDNSDRKKLKEKLSKCIHPLDPSGHPKELLNIVSGKLADTSVNVQNAVEIGRASLQAFENGLPDGFHNAISSSVVTMATTRKRTPLGCATTFDTEVIFNRTLGILGTGEVDMPALFSHELAPIPTSLFVEDGGMRPASSKSKLMNCLEVQQSYRNVPQPKLAVLDGCAILWVIHWPPGGTVQDLATTLAKYIQRKLVIGDVNLVFDRYYDFSTKGCTRGRRAASGDHCHLTLQSPLPAQSAVLTVTDNKVQLIDIICMHLIDQFQKEPCNNRLIITGPCPTPDEVCMGIHIQRHDMTITHEEADVIMVNQVISAAREGSEIIHVVCDDTDVFVLLLHFYNLLNLTIELFMVPTSSKRNVINIGATVQKHDDITPHVLSLHALTGCDSVSSIYGIGKVKAVKAIRKGCMPPPLGDLEVDLNSITDGATRFIAACYGSKCQGTMSEVRFSVWQSKTKQSQSRSFKLPSLPPTSEAFSLHVRRAHHQACIWRAAQDENPPALLATDYGWRADQSNKTLLPVALPADSLAAPINVLKLLCCSCKTSAACSEKRCSCQRSGLACNLFCECHINPEVACQNPLNTTAANSDTDDDYVDEDD